MSDDQIERFPLNLPAALPFADVLSCTSIVELPVPAAQFRQRFCYVTNCQSCSALNRTPLMNLFRCFLPATIIGVSATIFAAERFHPPMLLSDGVSRDSLEAFDTFHTAISPNELTPLRPPTSGPTIDGPALFPAEFRSVDGSGNNETNALLGAANTPLLRIAPSDYADGVGSPSGVGQRGTRDISNLVMAQGATSIPNTRSGSDYVWQWGQFLDHDMSFTPVLARPKIS